MIDLFAQRVRLHPHRVAVEQGDSKLSYLELHECSSRIAAELMELGVEHDTPVAICLDRTVEMVATILGILKAGGAYVPLDPRQPVPRMAQVLADAQSPVIVTEPAYLAHLPHTTAQVVLAEDLLVSRAEGASDVPSRARSERLAYVVFTSGSSGRPKGVAVEHDALLRFVLDAVTQYGITEHDRVLQFATLAFDAHIEELFTTLVSGATLVLRTEEMIASYETFLFRCEALSISVLSLPTAYWHELTSTIVDNALRVPQSLKVIMLGGEELLAAQVKAWFRVAGNAVRLLNTYGPTEATVVATVAHIEPDFDALRVPIGRAMGGKTAHVLDADLQPVPTGVPGELYLGGAGLARGYLHQEELTAARFLPDPFSDRPGARLYRTGDRVCWREDGQLEFLGRIDHQVKLRGYRIELAEIESALCRVAGVRQAVVMLRGEAANERRLVGYLLADKSGSLSAHAVRDALQQVLPEYMIPSAYVMLRELPLSLNGKVDRQALPDPDVACPPESNYEAPRDDIERHLAMMWARLLRLPRIGIHDNYFDLGGHSLLAVRVFSEIGRWTGRILPLATLLQAPTIAQLADILRGREHDAAWPVVVPIQPHGTKRPLFCIHGVGGNVLGFEALTRHLGADQPLFGLQARGLDTRTPPHTRVEDMAADYIREMRALQSEGPYQLLGQSFGGIVAFEMARQLRDQGVEVGFVGLLDTMPDHAEVEWNIGRLMRACRYQLQRLRFHWNSVRKLPWDEITAFLGQRARTLERRATSGMWQAVLWLRTASDPQRRVPESLWNVTEACWLAAKRYTPQACRNRVIMFRAEKRSFGDPEELDAGWSAFALGGVDTHEIPGDHLTILQEPYVQRVATVIQDYLRPQP